MPAGDERAEAFDVRAPRARVARARDVAAANLFVRRDERAHPRGEFEHARLLAGCHVDNDVARAFGLTEQTFGEAEERGREVVRVQVIPHLRARPLKPDDFVRAGELLVEFPDEEPPLGRAERREESAHGNAQAEALGVLARHKLARRLVIAVGRNGPRGAFLPDGLDGLFAVDGGARREDDEGFEPRAAHTIERVRPRQDGGAQIVERRLERGPNRGRSGSVNDEVGREPADDPREV